MFTVTVIIDATVNIRSISANIYDFQTVQKEEKEQGQKEKTR